MKISGTVMDAANEMPLAGAKVSLHIGERELAVLFSDRKGRFEYKETAQYLGETLVCQMEKDEFESRGVTYKIESEEVKLEVELVSMVSGTEKETSSGIWYYVDGEKHIGPNQESKITELIRAGKIRRSTPVWKEGMVDWEAAEKTELKGKFPPPVQKPDASPSKEFKGKKRVFTGQSKYLEQVTQLVKESMCKENLITQLMECNDGYIVQGKQKTAKWKKIGKKIIGLGVAVTVQIVSERDNLEVTIGAGKWLNKYIVGGIGIFSFYLIPLIGFYKQKKLFNRIEKDIEFFLTPPNHRN